MTIGSLFSGIGGLELGLERAGLGPVAWQVEKDPFCRGVLAKHWPNVTRFEDVTQPRSYPAVDVICGGFPCQDVSAAGLGAGLSGQRSGLWYHFASIVSKVRPSWVVVENVASGARRWLPTVRRHLHVLGYDSTAFALSAADVGAPHERARRFVVAYPHGQGLALGGEQHAWEEFPAPERGGLSDGPWPPEPGVGRMAHGVPRRVDRIRSLGNSVVPRCAEVIGRMIRATQHKRSDKEGT